MPTHSSRVVPLAATLPAPPQPGEKPRAGLRAGRAQTLQSSARGSLTPPLPCSAPRHSHGWQLSPTPQSQGSLAFSHHKTWEQEKTVGSTEAQPVAPTPLSRRQLCTAGQRAHPVPKHTTVRCHLLPVATATEALPGAAAVAMRPFLSSQCPGHCSQHFAHIHSFLPTVSANRYATALT